MDEKGQQLLMACIRDVGQHLLKAGEVLINYSKSNGGMNLPITPATNQAGNMATSQGVSAVVPITSAILPANSVLAPGDAAGQSLIMSGGVPLMQDFRYPQKRKGDDRIDEKGSKRIRNNWTTEENNIMIKVAKDSKFDSERDMLSTMRDRLGGSRTITQCKNHFKNLVRAGKIPWNEALKADSPGKDNENEDGQLHKEDDDDVDVVEDK
ncbi:hypothetical protein NDN08_001260 [Rhodosorus marinus]|uniref:Myb-like domain-containing protein n=1 Tax=Rhodosorus marinus TaxID=101924 RepID=A0AAV8UQ91_9RHOD|nr:hypothetical protein NDN08_001260 [Rhodosorus marinus]